MCEWKWFQSAWNKSKAVSNRSQYSENAKCQKSLSRDEKSINGSNSKLNKLVDVDACDIGSRHCASKEYFISANGRYIVT